MENKYINSAIIGGKNITASYSENGELLRLMFPSPEYKQFIDKFRTGVKINDSAIIYLEKDINNNYDQYYTENTNVLNTEIENLYFRLKIKQTDFAMTKKSILVKRYIFENNNSIDLKINFLIHSKLITNIDDMFGGEFKDNVLTQYNHEYRMSIFSKEPALSHQLNNTENNIYSGIIQDKDYIGMSPDSSISYDLGTLKPGEKKELDIFVLLKKVSEIENEEQIKKEIESIRKTDVKKEQEQTEKYWKKYVKDHLPDNFIQDENNRNKKINKILARSILLFPLLLNQETGGISSAVEVDENMTKCGKYSYCWPRDAVFITKALDKLKMTKETEKFYKNFCKNTQSDNGMWEQRFYTDGILAPCWGYQIDETASVIFGVYEHYKETKDEKFIKDTLKMCEKGTKFLFKYLDNILQLKDEKDIVKKEIEETYHTENRNKLPVSYDLWEMNEGIHLYSLSAIYAALKSMLEIYKIVKPQYEEKNRLKLESINKVEVKINVYIEEIKKYVSKNMCEEQTKILHRNIKDNLADISVMGSVIPFNMFAPQEKKILNTVEKVNLTLRTYTGGYLRFEGDHYMGGKNPWPIATCWMAMYYRKIKDYKKERECIDFIINSANVHGLLGEQVDNQTMQPNWVVGLGWSHAMFILAIVEK